ncbi:MAG: ABC transporter permease, partial [Anaerolineae bacterium]|nr:ABC transporter permease [Anaerolineae bacterium]
MSVPLVQRNLLHQRGKLILSVLSLAASLTLLLLLMGLRNGVYGAASAYIESMNADLIVTRTGGQGRFSVSALPAAEHDTLAEASNAAETEHALVANIIFTANNFKTPAILVGYNLETGIGGPWNIRAGRSVQSEDEIVVDSWLAQQVGIDIGDQISVLGRSLRVVGLSRETASMLGAYLFVGRNTAEDMLQMPGMASFYVLRLPEDTNIEATAAAVERHMPGVEAITPEQKASLDRKLLAATLDTPVNMMILIGIVIGIAVMGLTAYTAVIDRMREYGILKAVGMNGRRLRGLVIQETAYRAGLGLLIGIGLAYLVAELIEAAFPQFTVTISLTNLITIAPI